MARYATPCSVGMEVLRIVLIVKTVGLTVRVRFPRKYTLQSPVQSCSLVIAPKSSSFRCERGVERNLLRRRRGVNEANPDYCRLVCG